MYVCMCVCMCLCMYVRVFVCVDEWMDGCANAYDVHIRMGTCLRACMGHVCVYFSVCICAHLAHGCACMF